MIDQRLPAAGWRTTIAFADHHIEFERAVGRRRVGFGGEVPLINLLALRLTARVMRRRERHLEAA